jgi:hypothetical protein
MMCAGIPAWQFIPFFAAIACAQIWIARRILRWLTPRVALRREFGPLAVTAYRALANRDINADVLMVVRWVLYGMFKILPVMMLGLLGFMIVDACKIG